MNVKEEIEAAIGYPVSVSGLNGADFQCNACKKDLSLNAEKIAEKFNKKHNTIAAASVLNDFINFNLTDTTLQKVAEFVVKNNKLPLQTLPPQTVFFDYGGANVAKELHVGHLRSPVIGEALKRVHAAFGCQTVSGTYLGDWGLQMGLTIAEILDRGLDVSSVTIDDLGEIYPTASQRKKNEPEFYKKAAEITAKLQKMQEPYYSIYKVLRNLSVKKIKQNYDKLNCTFDEYDGESTYQPYVDEVLTALKNKNLAYESQGALIMDVAAGNENKPMPPIVLKKSNGGDLYATSDVAALYQRNKEFHPNKFIYTTDARQTLHFEQVFRAVKKAGFIPEKTELIHVPYGTINGKDGKPFKTRDGGTIKLEDIINLTAAEVKKKNAKLKDATAEKIAVAAIKFADLINNVHKDYIFDSEKCTSFEGKTGAYLLYTIARINSILNKFNAAEIQPDFTNLQKYMSPSIHSIVVNIIKLAESYTLAYQTLTLNNIADAIYNLAGAFSAFYATENIINEKYGQKQILLYSVARLTKTALTLGLHTLAIDAVDNM
jgi:arginyl-tRNA synthetase